MFDPPAGAFFVGYLADRPVVMGGWRFREDVAAFGRVRAAEVKRMYVATWGRRSGLARRILATLEASAQSSGADVMVLETGTGQPEAIALYRSAGYRPVEGFGYYKASPLSRYFGKPL
jgi:ribosomal protein S18 acetylase RimI-like enzyme